MNNEIIRAKIPATRNPFVNAQLVPAGTDPDTGEERFWTSAYNRVDGCTGALVSKSGRHRLYRFNPEKEQIVFYGAAYGGDDIMWLSSFLDSITKLNLKTGETETFLTGLPHSLSVSGFVFDDKSKKVFWGAYCQDDMKTKGLSFDTGTNKVSAVFEDLKSGNNQLRYGVENKDGTYTFICCVPDVELLLWDPANDSTEVISDNFKKGAGLGILDYSVVIQREDGAIYLPSYGWFDPVRRGFAEGVAPSMEAAWFGVDGKYAYGSRTLALGNTSLYRWDLESGEVEYVTEVPDALTYSFRLAGSNKIVCVNLYGFFYRIDAVTGAIETSVKFESDGIGHIDCVHRIDNERLLCTPFITQRFFEINLISGKSFDMGRATGGLGEVLEVTELSGKIYMASYTKGQLVEYDPSQPAHFPENPRIVVSPEGKSMRPVALCQSDDTIYYSCSHEYGSLGSTMIRYKPSGGESLFVESPLENHMIRSLEFDGDLNQLIAATTYHADCRSCAPEDDFCMIALLDPSTMMPVRSMQVRVEQEYFYIFGRITGGRYLCGGAGAHRQLENGHSFFVLDTADFTLEPFMLPPELESLQPTRIYAAGRPGIYVAATSDRIDLWNLDTGGFIRTLCSNPGFYNASVQDGILYLICEKEILIVPIQASDDIENLSKEAVV